MQRELVDPTALPDQNSAIPKELLRRYEVNFISRSQKEALKIRNISAHDIGGLIKVKGIVTRITEVRPMMRVATYICDVCGNEIYQIINKKKYTPVSVCHLNNVIKIVIKDQFYHKLEIKIYQISRDSIARITRRSTREMYKIDYNICNG